MNKIITYERWASMPGGNTATFLIDKDYSGADSFAGQIEAPLLPTTTIDGHIGLSYGPGDLIPYPFRRGDAVSVANEVNRAGWLFYVGHGWVKGWGGGGFDYQQAQQLNNRRNYPIVFTIGCDTGQFTPNLSYSAVATRPSVYAGGSSFASDWLFNANQAGAIAYFGETLVMENYAGSKLATYLTAEIKSGGRILGDVWRNAQVNYWTNEDRQDDLNAPRIYLGVMTFFGDPSLRLRPGPVDKHDYNHDGQSDLLFHNQDTGEIQAWFMYEIGRAHV